MLSPNLGTVWKVPGSESGRGGVSDLGFRDSQLEIGVGVRGPSWGSQSEIGTEVSSRGGDSESQVCWELGFGIMGLGRGGEEGRRE